VFRRPWEEDETAVRAFCADPGNARDLAALGLGRGESLAVLSHQVIVRLRAGDDAQVRARIDVLGALCGRNARPAGVRAAALEPFDITVGEPGEERGVAPAARHRFGGAIEDGPPCRNCRRPLHRLLSLDMQAPPLAAAWSGPGRVPVATCLGCQVLSSPLVLAHGPSGWAIREQASSPSFDGFPAVLPERPVRLEPAPADRAEPARHRVGGAPGWIQSDETPDCIGCGHPMTFLAQLDTDDRLGLQFGDDGRLYAFVCAPCTLVATLIQST
jgi:hypothetical protein